MVLQAAGATAAATYTVPAGSVLVLRDLDAYCNSTGYSELYLEGPEGQTVFWFEWNPTDRKTAEWRGRQVAYEGQTVTVNISVGIADSIDYTLSGYLLSAP